MKQLILLFTILLSTELLAAEENVTYFSRVELGKSVLYTGVGFAYFNGATGYFIKGNGSLVCQIMGYENGSTQSFMPVENHQIVADMNQDQTVNFIGTAEELSYRLLPQDFDENRKVLVINDLLCNSK